MFLANWLVLKTGFQVLVVGHGLQAPCTSVPAAPALRWALGEGGEGAQGCGLSLWPAAGGGRLAFCCSSFGVWC